MIFSVDSVLIKLFEKKVLVIWKENKFQTTVRRTLEGNLYLDKYYISNKKLFTETCFSDFLCSFYLLNIIFK